MLTVGKLRKFLDDVELKRIYPFEQPFGEEEITFLAIGGSQLDTIEIQDNMNGLVIRPTAVNQVHIIVRQALIGIRLEYTYKQALAAFYETVGLFRGLNHGKLLSNQQLRVATLLTHNALEHYGQPYRVDVVLEQDE